MELEHKRAKESKGENRNLLRAGRLSLDEREIILQELGEIAQKKYNQNLFFGGGGYKLGFLKNALHFVRDIFAFENEYWIDTGSDEKNKLAKFFEYGTGMQNIKYKHMIKSTSGKKMRFLGTHKWAGQVLFVNEIKGVRPILMFNRTLKFMEHNRPYLQRRIRLRLGI